MLIPSFLHVFVLADVAWSTTRVPGKSTTQIRNEMSTQLGTQPPESFIHLHGPGEVESVIIEMEIEGWLRLEQGLYTVTDAGKAVLKQLRPLLAQLNILVGMVSQ